MISGMGHSTSGSELTIRTPETILIVDDDPAVLRSLSILLSERYSVVSCANGRKALDIFKPGSVTMVISDVRMPGMSGLDLIGRIHEISPDTPVILMTAFNEVDTVVRAVKQQAFDFILKPFKVDDLFDAVSRAISHKRDMEMERNFRQLLQEKVQEKSTKLEEVQEILREMSVEVVQRLTIAAECRDSATGSHVVRISHYAYNVASELGLDDDRSREIAVASQMHDIGKLGIPDRILLKPGPLT